MNAHILKSTPFLFLYLIEVFFLIQSLDVVCFFFNTKYFLKVRFVSAPLTVFSRFLELLGPLASLALHSDKARGKVVVN